MTHGTEGEMKRCECCDAGAAGDGGIGGAAGLQASGVGMDEFDYIEEDGDEEEISFVDNGYAAVGPAPSAQHRRGRYGRARIAAPHPSEH